MKKNWPSSTLTFFEEKITNETKKTLYLVLRPKGMADEAIEKINSEAEKRLAKFIEQITQELKNMKFDNQEEALKCLLLKQMIKILDDMSKEKMMLLSEVDKKLVFDILSNKDKNNDNGAEK